MKYLKCTIIIVCFLGVFLFLNILVKPKYQDSLVEGSLISDYYKSKKDHEVIILGDCEVYANFSPLEMYRENGIKAYVRGSSQQMLWQSYYILKETLNYETPKVVVFSVGALRNGVNKTNEAYNRLAIDNMKWSQEKIAIIKTSMTEEESFLSYVFPLLRYHDRISSLTKEDFKNLFKRDVVSANGFIINKEIKPVGNLPQKRELASYDFDDENLKYLDMIVDLCQKNNIELLLVKAPSLYPYWYDEYDNFLIKYAEDNNLKYINMLNYLEDIGIDFSYDTYDGGLHLNLTGASKNSRFFSNYLVKEYNLTNYQNDLEYDKLLKEYDKKIGE